MKLKDLARAERKRKRFENPHCT